MRNHDIALVASILVVCIMLRSTRAIDTNLKIIYRAQQGVQIMIVLYRPQPPITTNLVNHHWSFQFNHN